MVEKLSRRSFIQRILQAGVAVGLPLSLVSLNRCSDEQGAVKAKRGCEKINSARLEVGSPVSARGSIHIPKVLLISIDSLPPEYLELNSRGERSGRVGNWLMPNIRQFLNMATWFQDARCYMPAATDMNHLNAIAGTSSAQTGVVGISLQPINWKTDGVVNLSPISLSWARDDRGRPVDTLFSAFKRRWTRSRTLYASGKPWVAGMFRTDGSGVDMFLTGSYHPRYIDPPSGRNFYDPPGDIDGVSDPESFYQKRFCDRAYIHNPEHFPSDSWLVQASLRMLEREKPDLAVILMAQMDDAQHGLGTAADPDEFERRRILFKGDVEVSRYNSQVYREAVLDSTRDVDRQFGLLMDGISRMPHYRDAVIVLYSDHGHVTHRSTLWSNFDPRLNTDISKILHRAGVIDERGRRGIGFSAGTGSSMGELMFRADTIAERRRKAEEARTVLMAHEVLDEQTGKYVCPWFFIGEKEMIDGLADVCKPGELFHKHFANNNRPGEIHWPDFFVFMKDGWQLPITRGFVANLGQQMPWYYPDAVNLFLGGHGSNDTVRITMAIAGPGIKRGKVLKDPEYKKNYRISDIAVTLARRLGLELKSTTVGKDRSQELV
jgi:arylsulfatase A-like enzyme